jgi:hypothetical protein
MSLDRRQFKRFETLLIVEISSQKEDSSYFFGITKNVSFEGFIFESQNYDLQTGDIFEFRLKHPQSKLSVPVLGEVVWNREMKFECYSGVKFHRFDNETKSKMVELISADKIENSGLVSSGDDARSEVQRNERTESGNREKNGIVSDSIGQAATHKDSSGTEHGDIRNGSSLPVNGRKHKDDISDDSAGGEAPGDAVTTGDQVPDSQKREGKSIQENVSMKANGSKAARRNGHRRRRPYALISAVFLMLLIAAALIVFVPGDIREKMLPQVLSSKFIENTDSVNRDPVMSAMNETGVSEPPPVPIDQSESLPDYDKETAGEQALTEVAKPLDKNKYEELADQDYGATAEQLATVHTTDENVVAQGKTVLLQEAERELQTAVVSLQDQSAREKDEGDPDHSVLKDSGDNKIDKARMERSVRKNEAVQKIAQKIRATVTEESKPASRAVKGNKEEKPAASEDKKSLQQASVQERTKTVPNEKNDKSKIMFKPENDETVSQKSTALQKPDRESEDTPKNLNTVSTQDKEKGKDVQIAKNVSGTKEKKRVQAAEIVRKPENERESAPFIKKASKLVKQRAVKKPITKKVDPKVGTLESVVISKKPERTVTLAKSEPKMQDVENVSKQAGGKYSVQVGAWKNLERSEKILKRIQNDYPDTYSRVKDDFHIVIIPNISSRKQGTVISNKLEQDLNIKPIITIKEHDTDEKIDLAALGISQGIRKPGKTQSTESSPEPVKELPVMIKKDTTSDTVNKKTITQSKKPARDQKMPKIALVLQSKKAKPSGKPDTYKEITDEYLSKYYTAYTDFFDDNSNKWDIFDIGAASARIEEGLYHIENKKEGGALIVLHYLPFPHSSDFVLEISIMEIKAGADNSYGFIFGAKDARYNYSFQIRENKFYSVKNYHKGVSGNLTTGKINGLLLDKKSAALLKIVKQADVIKFYVNNVYVDQVKNLAFYGIQIGFIVEGKSHIAIDHTRSFIRKSDHELTN